MSTERPVGKRFTHLYVERGTPAQDSLRMRVRLGAFLSQLPVRWRERFSTYAQAELGVYVDDWLSSFTEKAKIHDILDAIPLIYARMVAEGVGGADTWVNFVRRVFKEENLAYDVDEEGGVHFHPDAEFGRNAEATIAALQEQRYANVLDAFLKARECLIRSDGKDAIRKVFTAAEGLFRLLVPRAPRLGAKEAEDLRGLFNKRYGGDPTAIRANEKLVSGFQDWVDAAHFYRHEEGRPDEVAQPPLELAVHIVSTGASHLRWLAEVDLVD